MAAKNVSIDGNGLSRRHCLEERHAHARERQPLLIHGVIIPDIDLTHDFSNLIILYWVRSSKPPHKITRSYIASSLRLFLDPTPTAAFGAVRTVWNGQSGRLASAMLSQSWVECRIEIFTAYQDPPSCSLALVTSRVSTAPYWRHCVDGLNTVV